MTGVELAIVSPGTAGHAALALFFLMARIAESLRAASAAELLARMVRGEGAALEVLYEQHAGQAMAIAQRILRSVPEAEEVVQETFVELWKRAAQYDASRGGAQAWVLTIARTKAIDRLRSRGSAQRTANTLAEQPERSQPVPLELLEKRQDRERVNAALNSLPPEQRAAIELAYFEGLTQREIAARTNTPLGTVKTRVRLALEKLAAELEDRAEVARR